MDPSDPSQARWWSAETAADHLGVRRKTLYTYVSRGWIRRRSTGGRRREYLAADVRELALRAAEARGREAAAGAALRWGPPVLSSSITAIDPDGPYYRGLSALSFADRGASLEEVAGHLWQHPFGPARPTDLTPPRAARGLVHSLLHAGTQGIHLDDEAALVWALVAAVAWWFAPAEAAQAAARALSEGSVAAGLARAMGQPGAPLDPALVLAADHELNASTFAARVAAGTGASRGACVVAALATWSGPRHGLASEQLEAALAAGAADLPGFGHPLYPLGDPRAEALVARAGGPPPWMEGRPPPDLDAGLVAWRQALGLPRGAAAAVFAVGRSVGWLAHIAEQRGQAMLRPRARYAGPTIVG